MNNKKKILKWPIVVVLLISMSGIVSAGGIGQLGVFVIPEGGPVTGQENVSMSVVAKDIDSIGSLKFKFAFDPKVLVAKSVIRGDLIQQDVEFSSSIDNNAGIITIDIGKTGGFSGTDGSLVKMEFTPTDTRGMSTDLDITLIGVSDSMGKDIPFSEINISNGKYPGIVPAAGLQGSITDTQPTETQPTETTEIPTATPTPVGSPGFGTLLAIGAILVISEIYLKRRNR